VTGILIVGQYFQKYIVPIVVFRDISPFFRTENTYNASVAIPIEQKSAAYAPSHALLNQKGFHIVC
jgi:hypothetical protein